MVAPAAFHAIAHKEKEENKDAIMEIQKVAELMLKSHALPFGQTWVPCTDCNALVRSHIPSIDDEYIHGYIDDVYKEFLIASRLYHFRDGEGVIGRRLSCPNLLYCSDVTQYSSAEYPLVHYARLCELRGCFMICLQSKYTGNDVYVLEIFLPASNEDIEGPLALLSKILGTMKKNLVTLKLASGEELGGELSIEVVEFRNGREYRDVQTLLPSLEPLQNGGEKMQLDLSDQQSMNAENTGTSNVGAEKCDIDVNHPQGLGTIKKSRRAHNNTGVRIEVPYEDIMNCSNLSRDNAAKKLKVSTSTLKRVCREYDILRWPPRKMDKVRTLEAPLVDHQEEIQKLNTHLSSNQASSSVAHRKPHDTTVQNTNMVTVRAKYENDVTIKFRLPSSSGLVELQQEVAKRLHLEAGSYYIKYKDEEDELILIACDEDLQDCISPGCTSIVLLLEPK